MLTIIQIILTIFAWRKGWKWRALLPGAIALTIGALMGITIATSGGDVSGTQGLTIFFDLIATGFLIYMVAKAPKSKPIDNSSSGGGYTDNTSTTDTTIDSEKQ